MSEECTLSRVGMVIVLGTLCMKGLLCYLLNKDKEAAEKEIKAGLRLDPKNGVCWQTLGLFYRHCK